MQNEALLVTKYGVLVASTGSQKPVVVIVFTYSNGDFLVSLNVNTVDLDNIRSELISTILLPIVTGLCVSGCSTTYSLQITCGAL